LSDSSQCSFQFCRSVYYQSCSGFLAVFGVATPSLLWNSIQTFLTSATTHSTDDAPVVAATLYCCKGSKPTVWPHGTAKNPERSHLNSYSKLRRRRFIRFDSFAVGDVCPSTAIVVTMTKRGYGLVSFIHRFIHFPPSTTRPKTTQKRVDYYMTGSHTIVDLRSIER
jgi:hypothetical protein